MDIYETTAHTLCGGGAMCWLGSRIAITRGDLIQALRERWPNPAELTAHVDQLQTIEPAIRPQLSVGYVLPPVADPPAQ